MPDEPHGRSEGEYRSPQDGGCLMSFIAAGEILGATARVRKLRGGSACPNTELASISAGERGDERLRPKAIDLESGHGLV